MSVKNEHTAAKQSIRQQHRPAGFGATAVRKNTAEGNVETPSAKKPSAKRTLFAFLKPSKKKKQFKKPKVKRVKKKPIKNKAKGKRIGRTEIILIAVILIFFCAVSAAIIVINGNKTIHQMPVILRITEEPTAEPVQTEAPIGE